jgi:hypothetical protein
MSDSIIEYKGKRYKRFCSCNSNWDKDYHVERKKVTCLSKTCPRCGMNFWIKLNDPVITNDSVILEEEKLGERRIRLRH